MQYRATFVNYTQGIKERTHWYPSAWEAQDALMKKRNVGQFHYLGDVSGDMRRAGEPCLNAPRNGGSVDLERREGDDED